DSFATGPREPQLESETAAHAITHEASFGESLSGELDAGIERAHPGRRQATVSEVVLVGAARSRHLPRHVDAAAAVVDAEVLPEVRELQSGAEAVGRLVQRRVVIAGDTEHESANRIRRSAAVVEHVAPGGVAIGRDILTERAHEIVEERDGQRERSDR